MVHLLPGRLQQCRLEFQVGILPMGADGTVHGRVDADTFRIWKGTKIPEEAFTVLSYLITTAGDNIAAHLRRAARHP